MRRWLKPNPGWRPAGAMQIEVEVSAHAQGLLTLAYIVSGNVAAIRMPVVKGNRRSHRLWQHTCFEAFVRAESGLEYYEFNFSPSTEWAAYRFTDYRQGMSVASDFTAIPIEVQSQADRYRLQASLPLAPLVANLGEGSWKFGFSGYIEDLTGGESYWALAHPEEKPDFHHPECFVHEFSASAQT